MDTPLYCCIGERARRAEDCYVSRSCGPEAGFWGDVVAIDIPVLPDVRTGSNQWRWARPTQVKGLQPGMSYAVSNRFRAGRTNNDASSYTHFASGG